MRSKERVIMQMLPKISAQYPSSDIGKLVGTYIKDHKSVFSSDDELGLLSLLFSKLLGDSIDQYQRDQLRQMADGAMQQAIARGDAVGGIVGKTLTTSRLLYQEVDTYFRISSSEFDYFQLHPLSHPLANTILRLEGIGIADQQKEVFRKSGKADYNIEFFQDSASGTMGIWMSKKGIAFDATKLR